MQRKTRKAITHSTQFFYSLRLILHSNNFRTYKRSPQRKWLLEIKPQTKFANLSPQCCLNLHAAESLRLSVGICTKLHGSVRIFYCYSKCGYLGKHATYCNYCILLPTCATSDVRICCLGMCVASLGCVLPPWDVCNLFFFFAC
jgi:hypothetical protein